MLDALKIAYEEIDISTDREAKEKMREFAGATSLPPQIVNGDTYCGVS